MPTRDPRAFDKLAVTTQALHDLLVTSLQQVSGHRSAVEAQLDLPVDTPGRIVTEYADDIELVAHRRVEFHRVKSERAVAGEHDHPSVRKQSVEEDESPYVSNPEAIALKNQSLAAPESFAARLAVLRRRARKPLVIAGSAAGYTLSGDALQRFIE